MARALNPAEHLPLLRTLSDGRWHSGEDLAGDFGITRAALSKRVKKLIDWGVEVETQPGRGMRLVHAMELLDADLIRGVLPEIHKTIGIEVVPSIDSTNTALLAAGGAGDPQALLAEHQTAGRGRHGRAWHSPFGANLYLSLAWSFREWPANLTALPLAIGVCTARALAELKVPDLRIKWPNDLWSGGAKLGGILIEQRGEASGACRVVIGLGLNVAMRSATSAQIGRPWTTLTDALGKTPSRNALAGAILREWLPMLSAYARTGFAPLEADYRHLDLLRSRSVTVQLPSGDVTGIARGVDPDGALLLDVGSERHRILAGDVELKVVPA